MTNGHNPELPNLVPRQARNSVLIDAMLLGNPHTPWTTRCNDRRLHSSPANTADIGSENAEPWQISEHAALHTWFSDLTDEGRVAARQHLQTAIAEFRLAFADELDKAALCHKLAGTVSHTDWRGYTFGELEQEAMAISNNPHELWPVERKLASMVTFRCRMQPGYSDDMNDLPAQHVIAKLNGDSA